MPAGTTTPVETRIPEQPFVKVNGQGFTVDEQPFRFIGANAIYFGFYEEYGLSIEEAIQSARDAGLRVLRISLGWNDGTWGGKPIEEYDRALDIAARNGMYVIVNLGEGCCFFGGEEPEAYFSRLPYANLTSEPSQKDFENSIESFLLRKNSVNGRIYREDPTILAWDILNEPTLELFTPAELNKWLGEITAYIKSIDPNHLLTIGINTSPGIYSTPGDHYTALNVPDLDFFSFHYNTTYSPAEASQLDSIRYRTEELSSMGKPVVMEEFGVGSQRIFPDNVSLDKLEEWVNVNKNQFDAAFSAGASGALFWGWGVPETKNVLLWWRIEDHDIDETLFVQMLREYQFPGAVAPPADLTSIPTPIATQAVPAEVYVHAICTLIGQEKQTLVSAGTPVVILWGWKADSYEHLQDFISNALLRVTFDGKNISDHAPFRITNNEPGNYKLYWYAQVGTLSIGTHPIIMDVSWKKMIFDGWNTYGPGAETETQHDECEIVIQ
jgi:hypothetical protein